MDETLKDNLNTIRPLILLTNAFGLQFISVYKSKSFDYICYLFWLSAHLSFLLYNVKLIWQEEDSTDNGYWILFLSLTCANNIFLISVTLYQQQSVMTIIKDFSEVDDALKRLNIKINHPKIKKTVTQMIAIGVMIKGCKALCYLFVKEFGIWKRMSIVIGSILKGVYFTGSALCVVAGHYISKMTSIGLSRKNLEGLEITHLRMLYSKMQNVINIIHRISELAILTGVVYSICHTCLSVQHLYIDMKEASSNNYTNPIGVVLHATCVILEAVDGLIIAQQFTYVIKKANRFAASIHGGRTTFRNAQDEFNVQSSSLGLLHEKLYFDCMGLFPLNTTLIYSAIGTTITFIIFVVKNDLNL
ncbi:hypothetical protein PPYR_01684 [Photinus pyralis]|uniref:Gustatory receptor n=1 Tax=Photinus pyralis TaxID=7054 RepID=A0A1Y1KM21_PHOPY|nr:uncharacterized protein LOC116159282 [Photinus pyralis]XP_031329777.1 uncharacterized protein LOC116160657 [Photinus pyralis]KAB0804714.1 hypothetical protein PPYR_01684 [Photinus pyralis]